MLHRRSQRACLRAQIVLLAGDRDFGDLEAMSIEELLNLFRRLMDEKSGGPQVQPSDEAEELLAEMEAFGSVA